MTDNNNQTPNDEVNDRLIELTDEETGESILFEHLDTIDLNGKQYFVLTEYFEEDQEEDDVYIMTVTPLEDGEDTLEIVEDDDEVSAVFEEFKKRSGDDYEFID